MGVLSRIGFRDWLVVRVEWLKCLLAIAVD